MADEEEDYNEEAETEHPGLSGFSRSAFQAKYFAGKAIKYAIIGLLVGAAATLLLTGLAAMGVPIVGPLALIFGAATTTGTGILASIASTGAMVGAAVGAVAGAVFGLSGASEAADMEADKRMESYERREAREERLTALNEQREAQKLAMAQQAEELGLSPGSLPRGKGGQQLGV